MFAILNVINQLGSMVISNCLFCIFIPSTPRLSKITLFLFYRFILQTVLHDIINLVIIIGNNLKLTILNVFKITNYFIY